MGELNPARRDRPGLSGTDEAAGGEARLAARLGRLLGRWTLRRLADGLDVGPAEALSARELGLVARLVLDGPLTVKELVVDFRMPHSTMSAVVDRLEARGLVRRRALPRDRRSTLLEATEIASESLLRAAGRLPAAFALEPLSPEQRVALDAALAALEDSLPD